VLTIAAAIIGVTSSGRAEPFDWQPVTAQDKSALSTAVVVSTEAQIPLYACRATVGSGLHPGRFRKDFTGCHIGYGGQELSVMPFEILALTWQTGAEGSIPKGSLDAGHRVQPGLLSQFGLSALHPCRTMYQESLQVGEVARGDIGCSFGFGGRQVTETKYQVLWGAPWMTWVTGIPHQVPSDALVGGVEGGENFYICRAVDRHGLHPGKIKSSSAGCSIASDGREIVSPQFSLLVPRWLPGNSGTIPLVALPAGQDKNDLLFLCRAQIKDTMQIGRITDASAACRVGMLGGEITSQAYDVLSEW
jgi:hypothetical protein